MTVGNQASVATMDNALTSIAVGMRKIMDMISHVTTEVNAGGTATANLEALGYSPQDAATVLSYITWLGEVNTTYQGVSASLSPLWAYQM